MIGSVNTTLTQGLSRIKNQIEECCIESESCESEELGQWLPAIIPAFANWMSNQTESLCLEDNSTCEKCINQADEIATKIRKDEFQFHQISFLLDKLCEHDYSFPECQRFLNSDWPILEDCLLENDSILMNMSCIYYGKCLGSLQNWTCLEVYN